MKLIQLFSDGMTEQVLDNSVHQLHFLFTMSKTGCVLIPVLFNWFFAYTLLSPVQCPKEEVYISY